MRQPIGGADPAGQGQLLIRGLLPTGTLLGAVVRRESGIRAAELLSHVAILDVPAYHKLMFITDGGMVVAPRSWSKRAILKNALGLCRFWGMREPKAAVLCAVETVSPHGGDRGRGPPLKAEAERETLATVRWRAPLLRPGHRPPGRPGEEGLRSPVAGDADIFLVPPSRRGTCFGQGPVRYGWGRWPGWCWGLGPHHGQLPEGARGEKYNSIAIAAAMAR